jgi:hypothetical protein
MVNIWLMMVDNLVGCIPTPLKTISSSVGMMTFPTYGKIKATFQTTNQICINMIYMISWWFNRGVKKV